LEFLNKPRGTRFPIGLVSSSEFGSNHHSNQNRNQNNGEKLKEMGFERGWRGVFWGCGFHTELARKMGPAPNPAQTGILFVMNVRTVDG
jgi:hypothetical protein